MRFGDATGAGDGVEGWRWGQCGAGGSAGHCPGWDMFRVSAEGVETLAFKLIPAHSKAPL